LCPTLPAVKLARTVRTFPAMSPLVALLVLVVASRAGAAPSVAALRAVPHLSAGLSALEQSDYGAARRELELASRGADRPAALIGLARLELATGNAKKAAATAERAARLDPASRPEADCVQAEAMARTGKRTDAIALLSPYRWDPSARRAKVLLGELLIDAGRRADATDPLMSVVGDYNQARIAKTDAEGLALVAHAAELLRSARDANDAYNEAERAGTHRVETLLWRAELFLSKYDPGHAEEVVKEALGIAPNNARAHVAMARVKLDQALDFAAAEREIEKARAVDPNLAGTFAVEAGLAARTMDLPGADAALDRGLAADPGSLELLSLRAAVRLLDDDGAGFERAKKEVFSRNPEYSMFYSLVSELAEWEHRYDEIVVMMREAVRIDDKDAKAWAELGLNAIRAGDEAAGLDALRQAWKRDRFNVRVYNTLNLFEKDIATSYETLDVPPLRIRYHKDERAILERYVPAMLGEAWKSMVKRYGVTPTSPVTVELYATKDQFSVRTSGLPHVGIQGVCFGRTLAALSPRGQPFNWGNVLWHELSHVFAIQLSRSRVPRWFTEGLSEYETMIARPEWKREEDPSLYAALRAGRIPPIEKLNMAFTHVEDPRDVTLAYYASSQLLVHLVENDGMPKIVRMLELWGRGEKTPRVIEHALGIAPSELDRRFRAWLARRLVRYDGQFVPDDHAPASGIAAERAKAQPTSPRAQVELAIAFSRERNADGARLALDRALELDPLDPDAHLLLAKLARAAGDGDAERRELLDLVRRGNDGYVVRMLLGDLALEKKDPKAAAANLRIAHDLDPTMVEPTFALYDLSHKEKREDEALGWLEKAAALDQHDRKAHGLLLQKLVEAGRFVEARQEGEVALFVDVESPAVHELFARALSETGDHARAVFELESALVLSPPKAEQATIHARLANEQMALGQRAKARAERDEALRIDPANADVRALTIP
jgi:cellulose synthase operon protein C